VEAFSLTYSPFKEASVIGLPVLFNRSACKSFFFCVLGRMQRTFAKTAFLSDRLLCRREETPFYYWGKEWAREGVI